MKFGAYIIHSPEFPKRKDFDNFPIWCEWEDAEETPYLKYLCESDTEYHNCITLPYESGKETYYPLLNMDHAIDRRYLFIKATIQIENNKLGGYASWADGAIVVITVWPSQSLNEETDLYRFDRLAAVDENSIAIEKLCQSFKIKAFTEVTYSLTATPDGNTQTHGTLKLK